MTVELGSGTKKKNSIPMEFCTTKREHTETETNYHEHNFWVAMTVNYKLLVHVMKKLLLK